MSALEGHAKATRILAGAFARQVDQLPPGEAKMVLRNIGWAYQDAADAMEAQIKAECTGTDGRKS